MTRLSIFQFTLPFPVSLKVVLVFFIIILLSLFAGFRIFGFDRDFYSYFNFYTFPDLLFGHRFEPGFKFFVQIFNYFNIEYEYFLFFSAFIPLSMKGFILFKQSNFIFFWLLIYFLCLFPLHEMTQVRTGLATGFSFYALHLGVQGRVLPSAFF